MKSFGGLTIAAGSGLVQPENAPEGSARQPAPGAGRRTCSAGSESEVLAALCDAGGLRRGSSGARTERVVRPGLIACPRVEAGRPIPSPKHAGGRVVMAARLRGWTSASATRSSTTTNLAHPPGGGAHIPHFDHPADEREALRTYTSGRRGPAPRRRRAVMALVSFGYRGVVIMRVWGATHAGGEGGARFCRCGVAEWPPC